MSSARKDAEAVVIQKPVSVRIVCPYCGHQNETDYTDFCLEHGDPPDWDYSVIDCEKCGESIDVMGQDWQ